MCQAAIRHIRTKIHALEGLIFSIRGRHKQPTYYVSLWEALGRAWVAQMGRTVWNGKWYSLVSITGRMIWASLTEGRAFWAVSSQFKVLTLRRAQDLSRRQDMGQKWMQVQTTSACECGATSGFCWRNNIILLIFSKEKTPSKRKYKEFF